ncbi:hypothetical protein KO500_04985 [Cellulophaga baltica]|uniref:hypothetical protein n=1 Tax=Cellulophaga TaxID=104264 RepID=UPI001C0758F0|nr:MULTISPECIES: hypothetical protein [Cellulophaga]MBU2995774.1 hypothetical protein [Cellulophaga baltica]MDO6767168.1 hypothetical protein [Cellulophaga sp. 1_MG-2023]
MKNINALINILLLTIILFIILLMCSCRSEESIYEGTTPEDRLVVGSNVSNLLLQIAMNDGSKDNIIDGASCISVELPVTVIVNDTQLDLLSIDDFDFVEDIFNQDSEDEDTLEIVYPITIIFSDFTKTVVPNAEDMEMHVSNCGEENEVDLDIECVDIVYPIVISTFNTITTLISSNTIEEDEELYDFISYLDANELASVYFPVSFFLYDGSVVEVTNIEELEIVIETSKDSCDEEDNNDIVEPDCTTCDTNDLIDIWSSCDTWEVDKMYVYGSNIKDNYSDYSFNFLSDGSIVVISDSQTYFGTWESSGVGILMFLEIEIIDLPDFNYMWTVLEITDYKNDYKNKIELLNGLRSLRFKEECKDEEGDDDDHEDDD